VVVTATAAAAAAAVFKLSSFLLLFAISFSDSLLLQALLLVKNHGGTDLENIKVKVVIFPSTLDK